MSRKTLMLYLLVLSFIILLKAPAAFGILDQSGDGMSDLWQSQFGFSITGNGPPSQGPNQDPDGDGVSNLLEAIAGTDPLSATSSLGIFRVTAAANATNPLATNLQWSQFIGKSYQVQFSADLTAGSWAPLASSSIASSNALSSFTTAPRLITEPSKFFRISVEDVDPDNDGLTSSEEHTLGTNPNLADTDGDGVNDKAETISGSSPTDASDNGLPPATPMLSPMKVRIFTYATLALDYVNGGNSGLLTPYRIKIYEQNLATGQETLVHTTPDYGGTMFSLTNSVDLPNIANDPNKRYTAQIDLPTIGNDIFSQPYRRWSFYLAITANVGGASFIGVNGFEPISQTYGTGGNILRAVNIFNPFFEDYRATLEPVVVKWKPILGYDNVSAHIDPWAQAIAGERIFPDFKNPLDSVIRHKLEVVVKTSAALAGKTIFVKAFDVDDSTLETFDTPAVIDTNAKSGNDNLPDYLNTPQSGQFWTGTAWGTDTAQGVVGANGETKFDLRVGMQPGNNYRIVASVVDQTMITGVQVTSSTGAKYLGPALAQNGGAPASPLLTVWRRLWVENDSMAAIPVDAFGYKRNDLSWDLSSPVIYNTSFSAGTGNTSFGIDAISDQSSFSNPQNGSMIVQSIVHPVTGTASFEVMVPGDYSTVPIGSGFRLYDDDDSGLDAEPLPRLDLVNTQMKNYFRTAFIEVIDSGGFNVNKIVPFRPHESIGATFSTVLDDAAQDIIDKNPLWVCPIITSYQGEQESDQDPSDTDESLLYGLTTTIGQYDFSTVNVEVCRESYDGSIRTPVGGPAARAYLKKWIVAVISHEMGHQPAEQTEMQDHDEGELMAQGLNGVSKSTPEDDFFSARTILRFRKSNRWSK
jgi:Bacterial TSP3 repeat